MLVLIYEHMATTPKLARKRMSQTRGGLLAPYLFHFALFVAVFFAIIGGALFILNFASAYAV